MSQDIGMETIAIFVSRVDALVVASMLRGHGIHVDIGADSYASIDPISMALGGFRLWVFRDDYQTASDLLREAEAPDHHVVSTGPRKAIIRFALAWLGASALCMIPFFASGVVKLQPGLVMWPLQLVMPVNPQGRADYFLADPHKE